jgi:hypothetical protein
MRVKRKRYEQLERIANSRLQWASKDEGPLLDATFESLYFISTYGGNYGSLQYYSGPTSLQITTQKGKGQFNG